MLTFEVSGTPLDFPANLQSIKFTIPSKVLVTVGGASCSSTTYVDNCVSGSSTVIVANVKTGPFPPTGNIVFNVSIVSGVKNPIYETGPFTFGLTTVINSNIE